VRCALDTIDKNEEFIKLSLTTIADVKISIPPWVNFQSAGWVSFQSTPIRSALGASNAGKIISP
jgi:hypothetical protein